MAGKMNWTRVAKEKGIQERGHEAIAGRDRAVPHDGPDWTRQLGPKKQKKKLKHEMTPEELAEHEQARAMRRLQAAEARIKVAEERLQKLMKIERLKKTKIEEQKHRAKLSTEFEARLKTMSPEERIAFEQSQSPRFYRKRKPVIVEHISPKPSPGRNQSQAPSKARRKAFRTT